MQEIFAKRALTPMGWEQDTTLHLEGGRIKTITPGSTPCAGAVHVDTLLPALSNLHSHSFQRAMAGMAEFRAPGRDSFWTWRQLMYRFLDHLTPRQIEAIAALVFMEMQEAGFAAVGEFHYVHNQPGGAQYDVVTELSDRIFVAAQATGIGLTHLPVLYSYGGAGCQPMDAGQQRFFNSPDSFGDLVAKLRKTVSRDMPADTVVGIAPHSLRATSPEDLKATLIFAGNHPIHIHIAEQPKEVADISAWLGARPVEWLLANAPVSNQWCLIHATHMTGNETMALAKSGAIAGLCPITEANLGDGPFNGLEFLQHGGSFGVGSDSNIRISLAEELRSLEYSQRLRDLRRNVFTPENGSVGTFIYTGAAKGGAQAIGRDAGCISLGKLADLVAIDSTAPALCALAENQILDGLVFAANDDVVTDVWSAGRHQVQDGQHINREAIISAYRHAMQGLMASI